MYLRDKVEVEPCHVQTQHVVTYSLKKGVKKFREKAKEAAIKEMQQMIDRECFEPVHQEELKEIEKRHAMESLIFLSGKKDGSLKAQHCANGSTQRSYMQREEVSSPTVSTESTMLTAVIEAAKGRDVAKCDIPNAFIQTEVQEVDKDGNRIIMRICRALADLLVRVVPEYE
jgi:FKBP-type peptidyl-prolyl cis-trans isomerase